MVSPVDAGHGLASLKLPNFYHHFVQCYAAGFELDSQGDRTHDDSTRRCRVPDTYNLDALLRHRLLVNGEFMLEHHEVPQKNEGLIPHMRFGPGCQAPVHISICTLLCSRCYGLFA